MKLYLIVGLVASAGLVGCDYLAPAEEDGQSDQVVAESRSSDSSPKSKSKKKVLEKNTEVKDVDDSSDKEQVAFVKRVACELPEGTSNDLNSITGLIALINSLPKPTDLPCILDVLPKNLFVRATNSDSSVQPADGKNNPRIFLFINQLVLAIVAQGKSSDALEFSFFTDTRNSIKGEILLPVTEDLEREQLEAALSRSDGQIGTSCGGCHFEEVEVVDDGYASFSSLALRPRRVDILNWEKVVGFADQCRTSNARRCEIYQSLFSGRKLTERPFDNSVDELF